MPATSKSNPLFPPLVAVIGWLVPGGGYLLLRQRARGLTIGVTVLIIFVLGTLIGGIKVVGFPTFPKNSSSIIPFPDNPWFIGQVLTGPVCLITAWYSDNPDIPISHARSWEIGTLYTAVAGMLNLMAIIDSSYRAHRPEESS